MFIFGFIAVMSLVLPHMCCLYPEFLIVSSLGIIWLPDSRLYTPFSLYTHSWCCFLISLCGYPLVVVLVFFFSLLEILLDQATEVWVDPGERVDLLPATFVGMYFDSEILPDDVILQCCTKEIYY